MLRSPLGDLSMNQPQTPPTRSKQAIDPENTPPNGYPTPTRPTRPKQYGTPENTPPTGFSTPTIPTRPTRPTSVQKMMDAGYLPTGTSPKRERPALTMLSPVPLKSSPEPLSIITSPLNSPSRITAAHNSVPGLDASVIERSKKEREIIAGHTLTQIAGPLMRIIADSVNINYEPIFLDEENTLLGYKWHFGNKSFLIIEKKHQKYFLEKLEQQQLTDHSLNNAKLCDPDLYSESDDDGSEEQDQAKNNSHYTTLYGCLYTAVIYAPEIAHEDCYDDQHIQLNRILAEIKLEINGTSLDASQFIFRSIKKGLGPSMHEGVEASTDIPASPPQDNYTPECNLRQNTRTARSLAFGGNTTANDDERSLSLANMSFEDEEATFSSISMSPYTRQGAVSPSSMLSIDLNDSLKLNSPKPLTNRPPNSPNTKLHSYSNLVAPGMTVRRNIITSVLIFIASPFIWLWTCVASCFSLLTTKSGTKEKESTPRQVSNDSTDPTLFSPHTLSEQEKPQKSANHDEWTETEQEKPQKSANLDEWTETEWARFLLDNASDEYYTSSEGKVFINETLSIDTPDQEKSPAIKAKVEALAKIRPKHEQWLEEFDTQHAPFKQQAETWKAEEDAKIAKSEAQRVPWENLSA